MSTLLYIKANPKPANASRTIQIADAFMESYQQNHSTDNIITLDLYNENIQYLSLSDLNQLFSPKTDESKNNPLFKYAYQFSQADKYVIASPLWNLSVPAILKAYFDLVSIAGITFAYGPEGPSGLLHHKKAVHITSRGGSYDSPPLSEIELGNRYVQTLLGFFGVSDYNCIHADGLDRAESNVSEIMESTIAQARQTAISF